MNIQNIGHIIGFIALFCSLFAYTRKDIKLFKSYTSIGSLFWSASYYFLQGYTSAVIILFISIRQFVGIFADKYTYTLKLILCSVFCSISIFFCYYTWQGYISLLPLVATLISTRSYFFSNDLNLRKTLLVATAIWIVNAAYLSAWFHLVASILTFTVGSYNIFKLHKEIVEKSPLKQID